MEETPGRSDKNWRHNNVSIFRKAGGRPVAGRPGVALVLPYGAQIETIFANAQS